MNFAHPGILLLLAAAVPALAAFFVWSWRTRRRLISEFVPPRLQATLTLGLSPRRAAARAALVIAALAFLLLALARPRLGTASVEVRQRGLDLVVAIDTSRSMLTEDAGPGISRLQRAKLAALDLARLAHRDRLALIAFAGTAYLQCPLTIDDEAFRQSVDALDTEIIPQGGTSLGPAINTALDALGSDRENVRVLILFTDGEEHEPGALEAAARAEAKGLRVYTVGVGTTRGEIIPVRDAKGNTTYLKDEQGNVVKSALNEALLRDVATKTGGFYLPLQGARAIQELYTRGLEPLPRSDLASRVLEQFEERFQWPLGFALLLLAVELLLPERARTRGSARQMRLAHPTLLGSATQPTAAAPAASPKVTAALVALGPLLAAALSLAPSSAHASPGSALRQYEAGDYDASLEEYERLARRHPDDPRYRFNAGAAAYRSGDFTNAIRHFQGSLAAPDLRLQHDAFYNLGNAQFRAGETAADPKDRATSWEQCVRSYEAALKYNPQDNAAQHNLDLVRRRLEDLKRQQQKQQQQQPNQDQKKDQDKDQDKDQNQDQKDSSRQDQSKDQQQQQPNESPDQKDQPQPNQDPKDSPDQPPKDSSANSQPGEDQKDNPGQKPDKPDDAKKPAPQPSADKPSGNPQDQGDASPDQAGDQAPPGQMTPKQALRLLDTSRGEEKMVPLEKRRARMRPVKDW